MSGKKSKVIDHLLDLDIFRDNDDRVFISIPMVTAEGLKVNDDVEIHDPITQQWLTSKLAILLDRLPTNLEVAKATECVCGFTIERPRRSAQSTSGLNLANDPVAVASRLIADSGGTECSAVDLLRKYRTVLIDNHQTKLAEQLPTNEVALGKRLVAMSTSLGRLGITIERQENARPRRWKVEATPGVGTGEPSEPRPLAPSSITDAEADTEEASVAIRRDVGENDPLKANPKGVACSIPSESEVNEFLRGEANV